MNSERIWLYSGVIGGWWCYDKNSNEKINKMYVDYAKRNNIPIKKYVKKSNDKKIILNNDPYSDFVDFSMYDFDNASSDDDALCDYVVNTTNGKYTINFQTMRQTNYSNPQKFRSMKKIEIPEELYGNYDKIKKFLINNNVKGVSGVKF